MNIQEILTLPQENWLEELKVDPVDRDIQGNIDYLEGKHAILTDPDRADYSIPKWEIDENTNEPKINAQGQKVRASSETIKRTRLVIN